ncbi:unnamed protein product [Fraxinus pennsylvanica]|uniref:LOB domain-containing protein n=1 Tax=Fraxinus pennsylvanica TaxID=56036 RepID=A0AAD2DLI2_9LAMI|nr:unnamed protein product [Fraxinus pennsylvanica]
MRLSCNGCRVLRKGCSENCSIKPCLQWIKSPESQANATVFLAKFYGRAGLTNLINAGPEHLRPAIFRSLLYEACGRIVNPIYGSIGLVWSGSWNLVQNAVEAVLKGNPITQIASDAAETKHGPPFKAYDLRHVNKNENFAGIHGVRSRCRFKRSGGKSRERRLSVGSGREDVNRSPSHESSLSHQSEAAVDNDCRESENLASVGPAELAHYDNNRVDEGEIELELTLGVEPVKPKGMPKEIKLNKVVDLAEKDGGMYRMELGLPEF